MSPSSWCGRWTPGAAAQVGQPVAADRRPAVGHPFHDPESLLTHEGVAYVPYIEGDLQGVLRSVEHPARADARSASSSIVSTGRRNGRRNTWGRPRSAASPGPTSTPARRLDRALAHPSRSSLNSRTYQPIRHTRPRRACLEVRRALVFNKYTAGGWAVTVTRTVLVTVSSERTGPFVEFLRRVADIVHVMWRSDGQSVQRPGRPFPARAGTFSRRRIWPAEVERATSSSPTPAVVGTHRAGQRSSRRARTLDLRRRRSRR